LKTKTIIIFSFLFCRYMATRPLNELENFEQARGSERVTVSLPLELEDYIPEVEDFYRKKHNGRKLQWYHHMANGTVSKLVTDKFMKQIN
jgi:hypothetical protein